MRDPRFIAAHRGGPLEKDQHRQLALWAATCAEHVLPLFESDETNARPRHAIATARQWAAGEIPVGTAQKSAIAAHAAARQTTHNSAIAAARAAGHAAATAHMADHCLGAAIYASKAVDAAGASAETERTWQIAQLPDELRKWIISALNARAPGRRPAR